ncbi:MAG: DNA recombination protein RmuC [Acidobacteriaceae bacterium]|nr:DNA recombination protein RmuC [Acidobacteriaceae bacterium]MBV9779268.1 DNA recombination protein RmuC [Acidobacteriaceae bacterium]
MIFAVIFLVICLLLASSFAAFQFSEAKRWRAAAIDAQQRQEQQRAELDAATRTLIQQEAETTKNREIADAQIKLLTKTQQEMEERFRAIAADSLQNNSQLFLERSREQIQHLVDPVNQSLRRFEEQVQAIEISRAGAYSDISAQVQNLTQLQERVRQSTEQLKNALRSPIQRGRWGEMQLRRVVELAGMLEYCDFAEQKTLFGETNQRPDLIVRLPNHCHVVIDAKVSLEAYLRAIECQDDAQRLACFRDHARQVRTHVRSLGEKAYWQRLDCSPEFVVAFLPLESLFSAALEHDPELLDYGVGHRVVIATPVTLISLLLVIAHGWRQQSLAENIEKIRAAGIELYGRLLKTSDHFVRLGDAIERTVSTYNDTLGSLERNVLPSVRRFSELRSAGSESLEELSAIDSGPRSIDASKWQMLEAGERS